jgi:DNA polymerase I-like protein with 3'-5' exonuclease and polymerase domains
MIFASSFFAFSFEFYFSLRGKQVPAITPPKQMQTLLFYQLEMPQPQSQKVTVSDPSTAVS